MGTRTIHREMMGTLPLCSVRFDRRSPLALDVRNTFDIFPHFINDDRTNQRVLDGAGEQKRRRILYQIAHNRRFTAIAVIDVTVPFGNDVLLQTATSIHQWHERLNHMI